MSSKRPRKRTVSAAQTERTTLRQNRVEVQLSRELRERPTASSTRSPRVEIGKRLSTPDVAKVIENAGMKSVGGDVETHVELSAAVPWVKGRGWLEAGDTLTTWDALGAISFSPDEPNHLQGLLKIRLEGLTKGHAYVAEIRVGGASIKPQTSGTFHIFASDASNVDIHHFGGSQTLSVFIPAVEGTLAVIYIETKGLVQWRLDDVRVLHLGKLS